MYIQPNSIAVLLTGVPLDETYDHTIKFASETAQRNYFLSKELMRVHPQTYQRHSENVIRVEALADNLYHVNYLMFQNTSFGNKWFYAFVKRVEYINNKTTELVYEIDVYQTWLFEMQVGQCFVEREHILNDGIGASLTDEGLEIGDHEITGVLDVTGFGSSIYNNFYGVIATTEWTIAHANFDPNDENEIAGDTGLNVLTGGCYYFKFDLDDMYKVRDYVRVLSEQDQLDAIVNVFMLPKIVVDSYTREQDPTPNPNTPYYIDYPDVDPLGHIPKNMKLYQYPYHFLEASDNNGNSKIYKYEYFDTRKISQSNNKVAFKMSCSISPMPEMLLIPEYYDSSFDYNVDSEDSGFDNAMISSVIPRIPYSSDSYAVWLAQNSTWMNGHRVENSEIINPKTATNLAVTSAGAGLAAASKFGDPRIGLLAGAGAGIVAGVNAVYDKISAKEKAKLLPDKYNAGTGSINLQYNKLGFTIYSKRIRQTMMARIDEFFELYGYKTNELKVPNMDSRPHWNFVKTTWANISGNIPADDIVKLKEIFNNGITFWKNPSEVGNYTLNNH